MNQRPELLSSNLTSLGIIDPFALEIKINSEVPNTGTFVLMVESAPYVSTMLHEWTHYFQLVSTSMGLLLFEHRWINYIARWQLLHELSKNMRFEEYNKLFTNGQLDYLRSVNKKICSSLTLFENVISSEREICNSWKLQFHDIDLNRLVVDRGIKLIPSKGKIEITYKLNIPIVLELSVRQILEHSAKANQFRLESGVASMSNLFSSDQVDYYLIFLYFIQEGLLGIEKSDTTSTRLVSLVPNLSIDSFMSIIFFSATVSLSYIINKNCDFSKYQEIMDSPPSHSFHPTIMKCHMESTSIVFLTMIENITSLIVLERKKESISVSDIDKLLTKIGIFDFEHFLDRQIEYTELRRNQKSDISALMFDIRIAHSFKKLKEYPRLFFDAHLMSHLVIAPKCNFQTITGPKSMDLQFPWQDLPSPIMSNNDLRIFYANSDLIMDRLLSGTDFACYDTRKKAKIAGMPDRAVFGCKHYEHCSNSRKDGQLIENYCKIGRWISETRNTLDLISKYDVGIFYNDFTTEMETKWDDFNRRYGCFSLVTRQK